MVTISQLADQLRSDCVTSKKHVLGGKHLIFSRAQEGSRKEAAGRQIPYDRELDEAPPL